MHVDRIDPAFGHWFAGFVDGEGCFLIARQIRGRDSGSNYACYSCRLVINVRADELGTLSMIRDTLGIGNLYTGQRSTTPGAHPKATLSFVGQGAALALVDLFDRFPLRAKKARDFEVWRRAVLEWTGTPRGYGRDWSPMAVLHEELKAVRRYTTST